MPACRDNVERGLQSGTELEGKDAKILTRAVIEQLKPIRTLLHTATTDNGKEFAGHKDIATALGIDVYFAHPYHSWERGANENMNGLIRQYLPKGSSFEDLTDEDISFIQDRLNNRPRKKRRKTCGYGKMLYLCKRTKRLGNRSFDHPERGRSLYSSPFGVYLYMI